VTRPGGMSQYVSVPEKAVFDIGELPFDQGAFMNRCPACCMDWSGSILKVASKGSPAGSRANRAPALAGSAPERSSRGIGGGQESRRAALAQAWELTAAWPVWIKLSGMPMMPLWMPPEQWQ